MGINLCCGNDLEEEHPPPGGGGLHCHSDNLRDGKLENSRERKMAGKFSLETDEKLNA